MLWVIPLSAVAAVFLAIVNAALPRLYAKLQPAMMRVWFRCLARLWGLEIMLHGEPLGAPAMLACNHRSWLDIVALGATLPGSFISKAEIDRWPLVGFLARHGGRTLFISRGEMRSFKELGGNLITRLNEGNRVIFFPEGTVSAERLLLRFRPRLFAASIAAHCPVQPVAIEYHDGDGAAQAPLGATEPFGLHALKMLGYQNTQVRLTFLDPLEAGNQDEKLLAAQAQAAVASVVLPGATTKTPAFADTLSAVSRRSNRNG